MKKILTFVLFSVILSSCSKDDSSAESVESSSFQPAITTVQLTSKVPASLQAKSPMAWSQITEMEAYMNMGGAFMNAPGTGRGLAGSVKTWTYGEYTVNYSYSLVGEKYLFNYVMTINGTKFSTIEGWQNKDGFAGHWAYNIDMSAAGDPSIDNFNINFDWSKNSSGDYNFNMLFDMGSFGTMKYESNINHDASGNFKFYTDNEITYDCMWNSDGSGKLTDYMTTPATVETWK